MARGSGCAEREGRCAACLAERVLFHSETTADIRLKTPAPFLVYDLDLQTQSARSAAIIFGSPEGAAQGLCGSVEISRDTYNAQRRKQNHQERNRGNRFGDSVPSLRPVWLCRRGTKLCGHCAAAALPAFREKPSRGGGPSVAQHCRGKRSQVKAILLRKPLAQSDALSENIALSPGVQAGAEQ